MAKTKLPTVRRGTAKIAELNPAPYNPRTIGKKALEGLSKSIERYGVVQDIIVNARSGVIVGGHQRVTALKAMGETEVPVTYVDLDEADEKALNVALNSHLLSGDFVIADLDLLLKDIAFDLPDVFGDLRLDDLQIELHPIEVEEPEEEKAERAESSPVVQYNIIFEDESQQQIWFAFIKNVIRRAGYEGTLGSQLVQWIEENTDATK